MPAHAPRKEPQWRKRGAGSAKLYANRMRYYRALWRATPAWLGKEDRAKMARVYRCARRRVGAVVDHIVPLKSQYVCGLNVPWNLHIVPKGTNAAKSNRYWPGCPWETHGMLPEEPEPWQIRLL